MEVCTRGFLICYHTYALTSFYLEHKLAKNMPTQLTFIENKKVHRSYQNFLDGVRQRSRR